MSLFYLKLNEFDCLLQLQVLRFSKPELIENSW
jgi:hypothetical protein